MPKKKTDISSELAQLMANPVDLGTEEEGPIKWNEQTEVYRAKVTKLAQDAGVAGDLDEMLLDALVASYRNILELTWLVRRDGMVVQSPQGVKPNPAISLLQRENAQYLSYLRAFGFTPTSRNNKDSVVATKPLHGNHKKNSVLKILNG